MSEVVRVIYWVRGEKRAVWWPSDRIAEAMKAVGAERWLEPSDRASEHRKPK